MSLKDKFIRARETVQRVDMMRVMKDIDLVTDLEEASLQVKSSDIKSKLLANQNDDVVLEQECMTRLH